VLIAQALLDRLIEHAIADAPNECCGVVAVTGRDPGVATEVYPATNTAASPLRFEVDPRELLRIIDEIELAGHELGAIYHSHTRTEPFPSQTDVNFAANWPGVEWIIVGVAEPDVPDLRSYLISEGAISEVKIETAVT
jgi:[CysO sulfur-carrier protein]-S-L-cysteine hydrolase